MIKGSPLLIIGLVLFLWARGMTQEDHVMLGLGKNGHLELTSGGAAVSLQGSTGMHKLGQWFSFEHVAKKIASEDSKHTGFKTRFDAPMNWEVRLPLLAVMGVVIAGLVILMKMVKPA